MVEAIGPINPEIRLAQILGEDYLAQVTPMANPAVEVPRTSSFQTTPFDEILSQAIESLNAASRSEAYANELAEKYLRGEAELHEVMVAQSKMNIVIQLAVSTVNTAVQSFKEITQMQV